MLLSYWAAWQQEQLDQDGDEKCLVVKLSAEVGDLSDEMRVVLRDGVERLMVRLAAVIEEGQADGSLSPEIRATEAAELLYQMWLGAARRSSPSFDKMEAQWRKPWRLHSAYCARLETLPRPFAAASRWRNIPLDSGTHA
ncbi:TetR family transcriptional regulator C-terminal domain-containing protein [Caballeronia sordidicola]|uniref:Transcriptional regulator, TetR family n=1 Tax=Caballeronia sordidicola TaxID=196367 RepID=A0A226X8J9_CABSO|nr:TetR family transcriptional regulator C-terminal domain-containing protein [Caballeronia sordidicola]OXC79802.1 Transcriptional regulator, TetR family [Caballeronia sordidicola]